MKDSDSRIEVGSLVAVAFISRRNGGKLNLRWFQSADSFLESRRNQRWLCSILDAGLQATTLSSVIEKTRERFPGLPLFLAVSDPSLARLVPAGLDVDGYVFGPISLLSARELISAARSVEAGFTVISNKLLQLFCSSFLAQRSTKPGSGLSPREEQIMGLWISGSTDKEVAANLRISVHTVRTYAKRIFEKLGTHNRTSSCYRSWAEN